MGQHKKRADNLNGAQMNMKVLLTRLAVASYIGYDLFQNPQYELLIDTESSYNKLEVSADSLVIANRFHWFL